MLKGFIIGFTIGYLMMGFILTTAHTAKHNMELYVMEGYND